MLTKPERKILYDWISEAVKCQKGLASDFRDGIALLEILMHYHPRAFHRTIVERSCAPSKCKSNWESLRRNELALLGITIPQTEFDDELMPYYTGKVDENQRPYVEQLLWEVKNASDSFVAPRTSIVVPRRRSIATARSRSIHKSYFDELDDEEKLVLPEIQSPKKDKPRVKSAYKREILPPINKAKRYEVEDDKPRKPQKKSWLDKVDGDADGTFFGVSINNSDAQTIQKLQLKLKQMEQIVQKQEQEIQMLRSSSAKIVEKPSSTSTKSAEKQEKSQSKQVGFDASDKSNSDEEVYVRSLVYIEDQSQEVKGKGWINVGTTDGKMYSVSFDETTRDVTITQGGRKFKDSVESLEFDTTKSPLKWSLFKKWVESKDCGFEDTKDPSKCSIMFVETVKHYVTKRTVRETAIELISKKIKLNVRPPTKEDRVVFDQFKDDVEAKIADLRKIDKAHNQDYTTGVEIKKWDLISCAVHQVAYGEQLFGKIDIGGKYIHVRYILLTRAHRFLNGKTEFHSIDTCREKCVHKKEDELVYFDY